MASSNPIQDRATVKLYDSVMKLKSDGSNWDIWKWQVTLVLKHRELLPLVQVSWYDLPSFLSHLFLPLSVPCPISITFQLHLTSSTCLPLPLLQL